MLDLRCHGDIRSHLPLAMSFLRSWKALTSFTIRGRYLFLAVAFEEYFPVLIGLVC